jgi:hypothetical protein
MLEIQASDNGKELVLNEETPINVKMATTSLDPSFNLYELDTASKNWNYKGKDEIEKPVEQKNTTPKKDNTKTVVADNTIRPVMANPKKFSFTIRSDKNEFPELAAYEKVRFEENDNSFNPKFYNVNWDNIILHKTDVLGNYVAKLKKADTTISVNVHPVFSKENFDEAMKQFEAKHSATSKVQQAKEAEAQKKVDKVNKELSTYDSKMVLQTAFDMAGITVGFRNLNVTRLGYTNVDCPMVPELAYAYKIMANAVNKNGAATKNGYTDIYLVQKGKNAVFRFTIGEPVRFNPAKENLLWTLTDKNQVAFFRIEDYSKLVNGGENTVVPVIEPDQQKAFDEIRKFSL